MAGFGSDAPASINTPAWLKRLPGWHRGEDLKRHPDEIARRLLLSAGGAGGTTSSSLPPTHSIDWAAEFSIVIGTPVELKKPQYTTPQACLVPYTSGRVSQEAQARSSAAVSDEICRMPPLKEQFANVLRSSHASARAHAQHLVSSLNNNNSKRPTRPRHIQRFHAATSPRRKSCTQRPSNESPSSTPTTTTPGTGGGASAAVSAAVARRPTLSVAEYKSLKPKDRVRLRYQKYRDAPALAQSLFERTRKPKSNTKAMRQKEEAYIKEWLQQHTQHSGLDGKIAAARARYWKHWQHIMDERVASRDRFSPQALELRMQQRRVERLLVAVVLGSRAHQQHRRLQLTRERRERWHSSASDDYTGGDPVEVAAITMQRWFRWAPKPFVRKMWLEANGALYLKKLAHHRVKRGADCMYAFLRDLNRRCLGFKTRGGKSIDLRLLMHRFYRQVRMVQRCVRRFTVVRHARLEMLARYWERAEWDLAVLRRDRHVQKLRLARAEERRARERERIALECELAGITREQGSYNEVMEGAADVAVGGTTDASKRHVLANPGSMKLNFSEYKGDGMTSQARNNRRRKDSLSSGGLNSRHRSRGGGTTGGRGGGSARKMKALMETQLSRAMQSNSSKAKRKTKLNQTTSRYKMRLKTKRHCAQTTKLAKMTTEELAALLAESLDNKDEETIEKVLDVVDGEHDDLDTPSGGFAVEDFLERVDGDLRRDELSAWLRMHIRRTRAQCDEVHEKKPGCLA